MLCLCTKLCGIPCPKTVTWKFGVTYKCVSVNAEFLLVKSILWERLTEQIKLNFFLSFSSQHSDIMNHQFDWYNIFRVQPTRCSVSQFIYFCRTLYMFQTGFPSIIRSSKLHIQHQIFVRPILLPAASLASQVSSR